MADKNEIIKQNMQDLLRIVVIESEILNTKELTDEDLDRIKYCERLLKNITDSVNKLNR